MFGIPGFLGFSPCNNEEENLWWSLSILRNKHVKVNLFSCYSGLKSIIKGQLLVWGPSTIAFLGKTTILIEPIATFSRCVIWQNEELCIQVTGDHDIGLLFVLSTPVTQNWVHKKYYEYIHEIAENTPQQHFKCGHNLMGVTQSVRPSLPSWMVVCTAPTPIVYYNSLLIFFLGKLLFKNPYPEFLSQFQKQQEDSVMILAST